MGMERIEHHFDGRHVGRLFGQVLRSMSSETSPPWNGGDISLLVCCTSPGVLRVATTSRRPSLPQPANVENGKPVKAITEQGESEISLSKSTYGSKNIPPPPPPPTGEYEECDLNRRPTLTLQDELNFKKGLKNNGLKQAEEHQKNFVSTGSKDNSDSVIDALQKALNVIQAANISGNYSSDGEEEWSD